jgi:tripartite-type tricarboxylate transporter receptor subunit TctC
VGINRRTLLAALPFAAALAAGRSAMAQSYPNQPIRLIVGYGAGGTADLLCRLLGKNLGEKLGQPVVVENKPGGAGTVGALQATSSPADGYTIFNATLGNVIHSSKPNPPFNIVKDLTPVVMAFDFPLVFYASASLPVRSMKEMIQYIKDRPGQLNYASPGVGSGNHLAVELLKQKVGLAIEHVPYKSTAESVRSIMAGETHLGLDVLSPLRPHAESGALRLLAVSTAERSPTLPDVPSMRESGVDDVHVSSWSGFVAPAATPVPVIATLNEKFNEVLKLPEVAKFADQNGFEIRGGTARYYADRIAKEAAIWRDVIRTAAIKFE